MATTSFRLADSPGQRHRFSLATLQSKPACGARPQFLPRSRYRRREPPGQPEGPASGGVCSGREAGCSGREAGCPSLLLLLSYFLAGTRVAWIACLIIAEHRSVPPRCRTGLPDAIREQTWHSSPARLLISGATDTASRERHPSAGRA